MGDTGFEPGPSFPQDGAESVALFGDDERLRLLLEAWAEFPESVKDACADFTGSLTARVRKHRFWEKSV